MPGHKIDGVATDDPSEQAITASPGNGIQGAECGNDGKAFARARFRREFLEWLVA